VLSNPESKRNKQSFENFVSRLMELEKPIGAIAVDFSPLDTKSLCQFLDKAIPKLIEIGRIRNNVKLYLPLVFQNKLEILQNKKYEVKKTEQDYFLKDVDGDNFDDQFLYVDYGVDRDDLTSNNTKKNASLNKTSKKGMHVPLFLHVTL
jgi:hypothetical protein